MIKPKEYEIKRIDENSFEVTIKVNVKKWAAGP